MYCRLYFRSFAFIITFILELFILSSVSFGEPFISSTQIDTYLLEKSSPLANYGSAFVTNGLMFDVDPRLVIAIAGAETTFGQRLCADFNAWNWFWSDPSNCQNNPLSSWSDGIHWVTRQMWLYFTRDRLTTIHDIGLKYCVKRCEHWVPLVTLFYSDKDELGGDITDLGFSGSEPVVTWAKIYPGSTYFDGANSIQQTSDGGYIAAGSIYGVGGIGSAWILKLDSMGNIQWQKSYGGGRETDIATSIQQTSDGGYIVAGSNTSFDRDPHVWVLKLDPNGNTQWQKIYLLAGYRVSSSAYSIQQTSDGGYIVAGYQDNGGSYPQCDAWILKLDSTENIEWQKTIGGAQHDYAYSIQQTTDGGYIVAGLRSHLYNDDIWVFKLDPSGNIQWQKTYGGDNSDYARSIQQTADGGYIVIGFTYSFGAGGDLWVLKLDPIGDIEWQKAYGSSNFDYGTSVRQTHEGGYIVTGWTAGGAWLLKLKADGNIQWHKSYGGSASNSFSSVQPILDSSYVVTGYTTYSGYPGDLWVLKLDSNGNLGDFCEIIGTSDAAVIDTNVTPMNLSEGFSSRDAWASDTAFPAVDTNAEEIEFCLPVLM